MSFRELAETEGEIKTKRRICQISWRVGGSKDHLAFWTSPVAKVSRDREENEISPGTVRAGQASEAVPVGGEDRGGHWWACRALKSHFLPPELRGMRDGMAYVEHRTLCSSSVLHRGEAALASFKTCSTFMRSGE